jgi:hypothetical protein
MARIFTNSDTDFVKIRAIRVLKNLWREVSLILGFFCKKIPKSKSPLSTRPFSSRMLDWRNHKTILAKPNISSFC